MTDLKQKCSQSTIGEVVGISQARVSQLFSEKILDAEMTLGQAVAAYCAHLREIAAGRTLATPDILEERKRLIVARRREIEIRTAEREGKLLPEDVMVYCLGQAASRARALLEKIPGMIRRRWPEVSAETLAVVAEEVAAAQNAIAAMKLDRPETVEADDAPVRLDS